MARLFGYCEASSYSHVNQFSHRDPLLRQRSRNAVLIELPKAKLRIRAIAMQGMSDTHEYFTFLQYYHSSPLRKKDKQQLDIPSILHSHASNSSVAKQNGEIRKYQGYSAMTGYRYTAHM